MNLSMDAITSSRLVVNSCAAVLAPARIDDGGQIVGTHELADELSGRILHRCAAHGAHVEIVEHNHVHAAVERPSVALRIDGDRTAVDDERGRFFDRDLDQRERVDFLRPAVLEDFEVVAPEPGHEIALIVGDDDIHIDVVHLNLEGDPRGLRRRLSKKHGGLQHRGRQCNEKQRSVLCHSRKLLFRDRIARFVKRYLDPSI